MISNFQTKNFQFHSNKCNAESIFVALETGTRSGTEFIQDALNRGVVVVISQKPIDGLTNIPAEDFAIQHPNKPVNIVVENSLLFVQNLAREKFQILQQNGAKTIAVTGSVGKTTTKEVISSTLSQYGTVHATQGNLNNHIGLPFTILNAPNETQFLVLEMGMSSQGEIEFLTSIAPCRWNIVTNAGESHSANFADTTDGVLKAKFEVLSSGGKCFILHNLYERFLKNKYLTEKYPNAQLVPIAPTPNVLHQNGRTIFFHNQSKFQIEGIYSNSQTEMLCLTISLLEDVLSQKILEISTPKITGRGNITTWHGVRVINESYNASPASVRSAIENFQKVDGKKLCILGEMREIAESKMHHQNIATLFPLFDTIFTVGKGFDGIHASNSTYFEGYPQLLKFLQNHQTQILQYDAILVKASNGVLLWKLFDEFFEPIPK